MSKTEDESFSPLEASLLRAMRAIDNQVAREMQRTPAQREEEGVQKWKPFESRIENLTSFILNRLGDQDVAIDSLLVLSQALVRALRLVVDDLERDGLGEMRSAYCERALATILEEARRATDVLKVGDLN